jgi:hypothetical protein
VPHHFFYGKGVKDWDDAWPPLLQIHPMQSEFLRDPLSTLSFDKVVSVSLENASAPPT